MGIISREKVNNLLWLGRYSERVYTTLRMFYVQFDKMIENTEDEYTDFCERLNIPIIYTSNEDFVERYLYDKENPDSVFSNLLRAYDNAIVLRDEIGTETMGYLQLCVYTMEKCRHSDAPLLELQNVLDMLLAFWACADDYIVETETRNIIKTGKCIERLDLYLRLGSGKEAILSEYQKLDARIKRCGIEYHDVALTRFSYLLLCEKEDHPETDDQTLKRRMIEVLENILDY
ncbi:MAG: alpha-E domain-containing protein [Eubacterium sp.]|nr:alpha-E domain-containing protein [Eubacterium sp.]MDD7208743.1 alpha-E domain-containing protein [Lachnospiraceae bacterium]MDY5497770.1 alpha-E domain-containing protein [Anaerobutyricum sp.]